MAQFVRTVTGDVGRAVIAGSVDVDGVLVVLQVVTVFTLLAHPRGLQFKPRFWKILKLELFFISFLSLMTRFML